MRHINDIRYTVYYIQAMGFDLINPDLWKFYSMRTSGLIYDNSRPIHLVTVKLP